MVCMFAYRVMHRVGFLKHSSMLEKTLNGCLGSGDKPSEDKQKDNLWAASNLSETTGLLVHLSKGRDYAEIATRTTHPYIIAAGHFSIAQGSWYTWPGYFIRTYAFITLPPGT